MSDLQDALDAFDNGDIVWEYTRHIPTIVDAARRVANPDTFAAKQAFPHIDAGDVVGIVDTALGITEDTDG